MNIVFGVLIPFIGTSFGAMMVFFMKDKLNCKSENVLLGFSAGVMIAASVWSLLIPSLEIAESQYSISWIPATIGFLFGIIVLLLTNNIVNNIENKIDFKKYKDKKILMMIIAVVIHNIPEGMAVGIILASAISKNPTITTAQAMLLSIGVAIQNFPEGAIISMPLKNEGMGNFKSFIFGALSGIVEPIAAIISILLATNVLPLLPYFLSFAAGAMFYVVINELIPKTNNNNGQLGTIGFTAGFLIMMILDVALG